MDELLLQRQHACDLARRADAAKRVKDSGAQVGMAGVSQMAHVGVHLTRVGADSYDLSVFRGFSESFWEWITEQAEEFGYQVI